MNLQESHIQALRTLIEQSPALLEHLKQSKSTADSAKVLSEAARPKGLGIDESALRAHLDKAIRQTQSAALSDTQLDAVAGGYTETEWILISIFTLGIGCPRGYV